MDLRRWGIPSRSSVSSRTEVEQTEGQAQLLVDKGGRLLLGSPALSMVKISWPLPVTHRR